MKNKVNVLGVVYKLESHKEKDDSRLEGLGGYCAVYEKLIVIREANDFQPKANTALLKEILRHEIVHAFFYESGLWDNADTVNTWATDEELTDWIAIQGPKLIKAWREAGAL